MQVKLFAKNSRAFWALVSFIVLVIICANAFLAVKTTKDLANVQKSLTNTGNILLVLDDLHLMILSAESSQRGFLLTGVKEYLAPYTRAVKDLSDQIDSVQTLDTEITGQQGLIDELILLTREKMDELEKTVLLALNDKEAAAMAIVNTGEGRDLAKEIRSKFSIIINNEVAHRERLYAKLERVEQESILIFIASAFTSAFLLLGMIAAVRLNMRNEEKYKASLLKQNEELAQKVEERTQELTLYSEELARSNRELEDFAFVASHDLQEPLRKIRAFGDRLHSNYAEQLGEKGADYLVRMKNAAERMSNLISDLLAFSRVTTRGKEFIEVDLNDILKEILNDLEIAIEESNAEICIDELPLVQADPSQMHQVFLNLLSNAIKFRRADTSPVVHIAYKTEDIEDGITKDVATWNVFIIKDNGIGFEQEFAEKIFVPFQRLHGRSDYKGTGIGLAVCRRIVERHGGTISAQSEVGSGTVFTIKMPQDVTLNQVG